MKNGEAENTRSINWHLTSVFDCAVVLLAIAFIVFVITPSFFGFINKTWVFIQVPMLFKLRPLYLPLPLRLQMLE